MNDDKTQQCSFKIVLVGNSAVGKSSIITRYIDNIFSENFFSNVTIGIFHKDIIMNDGEIVKLHIWDSSGQEKYRAIPKLEFQDSQCVIFVYDITNLQSFKSISDFWYEEIKKNVQENILLYLVGNKSDLSEFIEVDETLRDEFLIKKDLKFKEVSAYNGNNIKELFEEIAEHLRQIRMNHTERINSFSLPLSFENDLSSRTSEKKRNESSCCL